MKKVYKSILMGLMATAVSASANGLALYKQPKNVDVKNGERIYKESCAVCHGEKGMAPQDSIYPPLNGQYAVYMITQLEAFSDDRPNYRRDSVNSDQMIPFAKMLSKKEMWDVSVYLEGIKERRVFPKEWWDANKEDIALAKKKFGTACGACHGRNQAGFYPSAPKLAGLPVSYLDAQLKAYGDGSRKGGQSVQMGLFPNFYSEEDIKLIFKWIESNEEYKK